MGLPVPKFLLQSSVGRVAFSLPWKGASPCHGASPYVVIDAQHGAELLPHLPGREFTWASHSRALLVWGDADRCPGAGIGAANPWKNLHKPGCGVNQRVEMKILVGEGSGRGIQPVLQQFPWQPITRSQITTVYNQLKESWVHSELGRASAPEWLPSKALAVRAALVGAEPSWSAPEGCVVPVL